MKLPKRIRNRIARDRRRDLLRFSIGHRQPPPVPPPAPGQE